MWVIIEALVILGCVIYTAISIMSFLSQSGLLSTQLTDIEAAIEHKEGRLEDYRVKAEQHQETVPQLKSKVTRLQQWINALKRQKTQVTNKSGEATTSYRESRDAAIRQSMASVQKRKGS